MPRTPSSRRPIALLAALALAGACGDAAPGPSPEEQRLAEGVLTLEDVERFATARAALAALAEDTAVARLLMPAPGAGQPHANVEEAARALESHAGIRAALEDAGLDAEEYLRTRFALQQALLAHDMRRAGGEDVPLPAAIPEENVELVAEHRARIEQLLRGEGEAAQGETGDGG